MLSNLLRPFVLARLLSGLAVSLLLLVAAVVAIDVLRHYAQTRTSESQLRLERRAELSATIVQTALGIAIFDLALTALMADHLSEAIRGAMCAYGVFSSNPDGFAPLLSGAVAALACAAWLALHRLDLALLEPRLTKRKFAALLLVAPLVWLDLWLTTRWALHLDLGVVATCCSASIDRAGVQTFGAAPGAGREGLYYAALGVAALAAVGALWLWRRPGRLAALGSGLLSLAASGLSLPAIVGYVAPHVYENPRHLCPFCLLHADAWGIGWPLFGAVFAGAALGLSTLVVESQRGAAAEASDALEKRLAKAGAAAQILTLILCALPVLRYSILTGGASLFGGP